VKKFATSEIVLSTYDDPELYAGEAAVWEALKVSELQYTGLSCGICMTTLGTDTPKRVAGALAGLRPCDCAFNALAGMTNCPATVMQK
jgi:hypothetical protein